MIRVIFQNKQNFSTECEKEFVHQRHHVVRIFIKDTKGVLYKIIGCNVTLMRITTDSCDTCLSVA